MEPLNQQQQQLEFQNVDSSPQLIKVYADSQTKKRIFLHWCSFFIITAIFYLLTLAFPSSIIEVGFPPCDKNQEVQITDTEFSCSKYRSQSFFEYPKVVYLVPDVSKHNIFLLTNGYFTMRSTGQVSLSLNLTYTIDIYSVSIDDNGIKQNSHYLNKTHYQLVTCKKLTEQSNELICEDFSIAYQSMLGDLTNYLFIITFDKIFEFDRFQRIELTSLMVKREFTESLIALRYVFLAISFCAWLAFYFKLKPLKRENIVIEQKLVFTLSILLCFFNDPLYAATILIPNRTTAIIGVIFLSNFVSFLIFYWLVTFSRIINENGQKDTKSVTIDKAVLCFLIWLSMVISYSLLQMEFFSDPSATYDSLNSSAFLAFKIIFFLMVAIALVILLFYYIQYCRFYNSRIWRFKLIGLFTIYFVFSFSLFLYTGSFSLYEFDGNRILLTITILNLYIYYMQYLWSPSAEGLSEQNQQKELQDQILGGNRDYEQIEEDSIKIELPDEKGNFKQYQEQKEEEQNEIQVDD